VRVARAVVLGVSIGLAATIVPARARPPEYRVMRVEPAAYTSFKHVQRRPMFTLARVIEGDIPPAMRGGKEGLNPSLINLLNQVENHFGRPVTIISGCRSYRHNREIGGARKSYHLRCMAADIRVAGFSDSQVLRYVRDLPGRGGVGTYCRTSMVHVDVGPRRSWHWGCGSRKKIARKKTVNWKRAS
jgi:uncharacterized protein YcbK (DUF882 family)